MEIRDFLLTLTGAPAAAVIFVATLAISIHAFRNRAFLERMMLNPHAIVRERRPWSVLTYGLVHADWMHLAFNMFAYFTIAFEIQHIAGATHFLAIYIGSYILGVLPAVSRHADDPGYRSLGASGAVAGLFFSGLVYMPDARISLLLLPVPMPYPVFAVLFLAMSWYGARRNIGNIGHETHLYGAIAGLIITILIDPAAAAGAVAKMLG